VLGLPLCPHEANPRAPLRAAAEAVESLLGILVHMGLVAAHAAAAPAKPEPEPEPEPERDGNLGSLCH
jgi:hypothetical protein